MRTHSSVILPLVFLVLFYFVSFNCEEFNFKSHNKVNKQLNPQQDTTLTTSSLYSSSSPLFSHFSLELNIQSSIHSDSSISPLSGGSKPKNHKLTRLTALSWSDPHEMINQLTIARREFGERLIQWNQNQRFHQRSLPLEPIKFPFEFPSSCFFYSSTVYGLTLSTRMIPEVIEENQFNDKLNKVQLLDLSSLDAPGLLVPNRSIPGTKKQSKLTETAFCHFYLYKIEHKTISNKILILHSSVFNQPKTINGEFGLMNKLILSGFQSENAPAVRLLTKYGFVIGEFSKSGHLTAYF
jgi:hypothetical protein